MKSSANWDDKHRRVQAAPASIVFPLLISILVNSSQRLGKQGRYRILLSVMFSRLPVIRATYRKQVKGKVPDKDKRYWTSPTQYEKWQTVHGHYLLMQTKDGQMSDTWIES